MPVNPFAHVEKHILDPARVRTIRDGFSWIDRRFVRDGIIERLSSEEILLYLFLVCVADANGLSFYGDRRVAATLKIPESSLGAVRHRLVDRGLIAFETPLYQVLELPAHARVVSERSGGLSSIGDVLRELAHDRPRVKS